MANGSVVDVFVIFGEGWMLGRTRGCCLGGSAAVFPGRVVVSIAFEFGIKSEDGLDDEDWFCF